MQNRFLGRRVLVTGAGSGIGLAVARRVAEEGGKVVLVGRTSEKLDAALPLLKGDGHRAIACDLEDETATENMVRQIATELGPFYAATLCSGAHDVRPLVVSKATHFTDLYSANVLTALNVLRPLVRALDPAGSSVVLTSSAAAVRGCAGVSAYSAAKGALSALARSLAVELVGKKIRVNTVIAGVVKTPMSDRFLATLPQAQVEAIESSHPLGLGVPEDVAAAIAFLASSDARWITGTELVVDGGLTCK